MKFMMTISVILLLVLATWSVALTLNITNQLEHLSQKIELQRHLITTLESCSQTAKNCMTTSTTCPKKSSESLPTCSLMLDFQDFLNLKE